MIIHTGQSWTLREPKGSLGSTQTTGSFLEQRTAISIQRGSYTRSPCRNLVRGGAAGKEGRGDIEKPPRVVSQLEGNPGRIHKAARWAQGSRGLGAADGGI